MAEPHIDPALREFYERSYTGPSAFREATTGWKLRHLYDLCAGVPHAAVLDVGAGEGSFAQRYCDDGFARTVTALEVASSAVAAIRSREIACLKDAAVFDGYTLPYEDDSFDLVTLINVMMHIEHPRLLLREAARVGRHVYLHVPLEDTVRLDCAEEAIGHLNFYSRKTMQSLVRTSGLETVAARVSVAPAPDADRGKARRARIKEAAHKVLPGAAEAVFTYHLSVLCRRPPDR
jgi:SAM-dependent methyltransferase